MKKAYENYDFVKKKTVKSRPPPGELSLGGERGGGGAGGGGGAWRLGLRPQTPAGAPPQTPGGEGGFAARTLLGAPPRPPLATALPQYLT